MIIREGTGRVGNRCLLLINLYGTVKGVVLEMVANETLCNSLIQHD